MTTRVGLLLGGLAALFVSPAALSAPATFHSAVIGDNPLVWYQLSEASGNVVNHGSLGSAYNATVFGTPARQATTIGVDGDGEDLLVWQRGESPNPNSATDFAAWRGSFGFAADAAVTAVVPEPATTTLGLLALFAVSRYRTSGAPGLLPACS